MSTIRGVRQAQSVHQKGGREVRLGNSQNRRTGGPRTWLVSLKIPIWYVLVGAAVDLAQSRRQLAAKRAFKGVSIEGAPDTDPSPRQGTAPIHSEECILLWCFDVRDHLPRETRRRIARCPKPAWTPDRPRFLELPGVKALKRAEPSDPVLGVGVRLVPEQRLHLSHGEGAFFFDFSVTFVRVG